MLTRSMKRSAVLSKQKLTKSLDISSMEHLLDSHNDIEKNVYYFVVTGTLMNDDDWMTGDILELFGYF